MCREMVVSCQMMVVGRINNLKSVNMKSYKTLDVWKFSMQLVKEVYLLTKSYPKEEQYTLVSQTNRAAVSIPLNIAEGFGRQYKKDTLQFFHVSRGSLYELETVLNIGLMINIAREEEVNKVLLLLETVLRLLNGLINSFEKRIDLK